MATPKTISSAAASAASEGRRREVAGAELARLSALLGSAEQLVPELEQQVGADGFAIVTAVEALLQCARTSLAEVVRAMEREQAHG